MRRHAANCSQAPINCQGSASQTKSKARFRISYSNSGIKTLEREGALCPGVVIRCCSRPSTNSPKTAALSGQPCFTHIRHSKMSEMPFWTHSCTVMRVQGLDGQSSIGPRIPMVSNTCHSKPRGTVSNAFLKSTKQECSLLCI